MIAFVGGRRSQYVQSRYSPRQIPLALVSIALGGAGAGPRLVARRKPRRAPAAQAATRTAAPRGRPEGASQGQPAGRAMKQAPHNALRHAQQACQRIHQRSQRTLCSTTSVSPCSTIRVVANKKNTNVFVRKNSARTWWLFHEVKYKKRYHISCKPFENLNAKRVSIR